MKRLSEQMEAVKDAIASKSDKDALARAPSFPGPVCRLLARQGLARFDFSALEAGTEPPDGLWSPADYDAIFQPNPQTLIDPVKLEGIGGAFLARIKLLAFAGGGFLKIAPGRSPLLYVLASSGNGKTELLRIVSLFLDRAAAVPNLTNPPIVSLGVSFSGNFSVQPEEQDCVKFARGYYLLLYVRLLYCELAEYGDPLLSFPRFVQDFYRGLDAEEYTPADVQAEARGMVARKVQQAGPGARVVLLVDELGLLSTSSSGAYICKMLKQDIRGPIRSEGCSLADLGRGVAVYTSLDRALMIAEQTASRRSALMVQKIDPPPFSELYRRMLDALWSRPRGADERLAVSVGSVRLKMKVNDCAEIYALAAGTNWRVGVLTAAAVGAVDKLDFFDVVDAVNAGRSSGVSRLAAEPGSGPAITVAQDSPPLDLWSSPPEFRDAVLSAVILSREVDASERVLPASSKGGVPWASQGGDGGPHATENGARASALDSAADAPVQEQEDDAARAQRRRGATQTNDGADAVATWEGAQGGHRGAAQAEDYERVLERRDAVAKIEYMRLRNMSVRDLTFGDVRALAYITAAGDDTFVPDTTVMDAITGVTSKCAPSPLMNSFKQIVNVVNHDKPGDPIDRASASPSRTESQYKQLTGAGWENIVMYWEHLHSIARSQHPTAYSAVTLVELFGLGASYVGDDPVLQDVIVNAAIGHKEVRQMAGKAGDGNQPDTVKDLLLLGRDTPDKVTGTVCLLPKNSLQLDGVFFLMGPDGPVAVWVQAKKRGATALPDSNPVTILRQLHKDESKLVHLYGGQDLYDYWLPRSCYLHVEDNEMTSSAELPAPGSWTQRTIIRTRNDLPLLIGRTVYSLGRVLALVAGQDIFAD